MGVEILTGTGNATRATVATSAGNTIITCDRPANVVEGEYMLAIMSNLDILNPSSAVTHPTDWEQIYSNHGLDHFRRRITIAYKKAGASEPSNYTWTFGSDVRDDDIQIFRVTGANATTFSDATPTSNDAGTVTNITSPSIATVTDGALVVYLMAGSANVLAAEDANYPAGTSGVFVKRSRNHSYGIAYGMATEVKATAGASGSKTWTGAFSSSTQSGAATIAIRPAPSGPTITDVDTDEAVCHGQTITITCTNAGASQGSSTLTIGGVSVTPTSWSETSIQCVVPLNVPTGTQDIVLTTSGGSDTQAVTVVAPKLRFRGAPDNTLIKHTNGSGAASDFTGTYDEWYVWDMDPEENPSAALVASGTNLSVSAGVGEIAASGYLAVDTTYWIVAHKTDNTARVCGPVTATEA